MSNIIRARPRSISFIPAINPYAEGSVLAQFGNTKVHITVAITEGVPKFLQGKGSGWLTAEYSMLPGSTHTRSERERTKVSGRTQEIQRLIGRSLRAILDFSLLGERTLNVDCDVLVADGGTRTASIAGGFVAIELAVQKLLRRQVIKQNPIKDALAAVSVGINADGKIIADLNYQEDSQCAVDMNVVMTAQGKFVEIQGTAEGAPFADSQLQDLLACAREALSDIFTAQRTALDGYSNA